MPSRTAGRPPADRPRLAGRRDEPVACRCSSSRRPWLVPPTLLAPATAAALVMLAPMAAGQALLDLFLAATRWKQAIRYEVVARSVVEPWSLLAGCGLAWLLGWRAEGLAIGYGCGTLAALAYAILGARRQFGGFRLAGYRPAAGAFAADLAELGEQRFDRPRQRPLHAGRPLPGRNPPRRGGGRPVRHGAADRRAAPPGAAELRRPAHPPRRQEPRDPRLRRELGGARLGDPADPHPAAALSARRGRRRTSRCSSGWGPASPPLTRRWPILAVAETLQSAFSIGDLVFVYLRPGLGLAG